MANNSLWHKVTDKEKEQIAKDSKKLLNEFASKLGKIKSKEIHFENELGTREEGDGWTTDPDFREITFTNAPFVEGNSIVAEKGGWK
ncbi:MAG: hypothetical protein KJ592_01875 [Nanoarchaeota archaeon]|nr:hypothetical protein [Nanoarchaeota archaeon]